MTIVRRAVARFREQDWIAVSIELVVVVFGVFLGIQAANWNEDREQDRKSAVFTERLKDDLRAEAWNIEMQIGYHEQVQANARRAADALSGRDPLSDEALLVAAYRATQYNDNVRQRATYDELTSTGDLGLIRDYALRKLAMNIYTTQVFDWFTDEGRASPYRAAFRRRVPYRIQTALETTCGDRVVASDNYAGIATKLDYPCRIDAPPAEVAEAATALRSDPEILQLLNQRIVDLGTNIGNLTFYDADSLRKNLRASVLEKR
ncbi:MAG: DUF6090 family protein [Thermomonas sp.]